MAIDADLSAGLIDEAQARARRQELEDESNFFGSMDGAAKFVRGDAIAGLLITFINVVGGIIIGVAQKDLSFAEAGHTYTLLTVGDGLVTQIPALIVSIGAGLLVSKAGVAGSADQALFGQLGGYPRALGVSSFLMLILGFCPGHTLPALHAAQRRRRRALPTPQASAMPGCGPPKPRAPPPARPPSRRRLKNRSPPPCRSTRFAWSWGYGLLPMINEQGGHRLTDQIRSLRHQLAQEMGFVLPSVRIQDNLQLPPNCYVLRIKEGRGRARRPAALDAADHGSARREDRHSRRGDAGADLRPAGALVRGKRPRGSALSRLHRGRSADRHHHPP